MQPANFPLEIYRGDSSRMRVKLYDADKNPIDLTDIVAKSEIRDRPAGTVVVPLDCTITLPNIVEIVLTAANSSKLPVQGVWDLQLTYPNGGIKTPMAGLVKVTPDVTDSTPYVEHRGP
jgi:hypothetical protein